VKLGVGQIADEAAESAHETGPLALTHGPHRQMRTLTFSWRSRKTSVGATGCNLKSSSPSESWGDPSRRAVEQAGKVREDTADQRRVPLLPRHPGHRLPTRRLTTLPTSIGITLGGGVFRRACPAAFPVQHTRFPICCPITAPTPTVLPPSLGPRPLPGLRSRCPKAT